MRPMSNSLTPLRRQLRATICDLLSRRPVDFSRTRANICDLLLQKEKEEHLVFLHSIMTIFAYMSFYIPLSSACLKYTFVSFVYLCCLFISFG
jgi:hypothetical protein